MNQNARIALVAALSLAIPAGVESAPPGALHGKTASADSTGRDSTVYLDTGGNVHVVAFGGKDVRITQEGRYRDPKLGPDGRTVGMLVTSTIDISTDEERDSIEVDQVLRIWRGGREIRRIEPGGFIRAWGFANDGRAVAVYSGALHFAGFYVLYDLDRGVELARAADPVTDSSPGWVRALVP